MCVTLALTGMLCHSTDKCPRTVSKYSAGKVSSTNLTLLAELKRKGMKISKKSNAGIDRILNQIALFFSIAI